MKFFGLDMADMNQRIVVWASVTVIAIVTSFVQSVVLMTYVIQAEDRVQARMGRLASTINRTANDVNRSLGIAANDLDELLYLNRYPWTRNEMAEFCIKAEEINQGFRCPDVLAISPDFNMVRNKRPTVNPEPIPEE